MKQNTTILILYSELAAYTISCLEAVLKKYAGVALHIVKWPVNNEAPFVLKFSDHLKVYERNGYDETGLRKLADKIKPDLIICSGWIDKGYLGVCRVWKKRIPVVLTMDNKWNGSVRQWLGSVLSPFTVSRYFTDCWVPGIRQAEFAKRLGFKMKKIKSGFYCCDLDLFNSVYTQTGKEKEQCFPHCFIYVGRYYEFKGVKELWSAFVEFKKLHPSDWKLVCVGNGAVPPVNDPDIVHYGFMQPQQLRDFMKGAGVFIMPSRVEPWGVVAQEFAAAGFPMLLSRNVGSSEKFLEEGRNGFAFEAQNEDQIIECLKKITALPDRELAVMGSRSHELAQSISPEGWADTLMGFIATPKYL
jgi:glycosyltransferase involved in cell wall biosynthesis